MKNKLWLLQLPFIVLFTLAFYVSDLGSSGDLDNTFLRDHVYGRIKRMSTTLTDWKFRIRGPEAPKNNIVIVTVDSDSIAKFGRWPWHRDVTAELIDRIFKAGAKAVGLDIVFSEPDKRVPDEIANLMRSEGRDALIRQAETDSKLQQTIFTHASKLVLGWTTDGTCQPLYDGHDGCPVAEPEIISSFPKDFDKFSYSEFHAPRVFEIDKTPFVSMISLINNIDDFSMAAEHGGYFNANQDPDGYIRRVALFMMANGKPYPVMPLELARVGLGDKLQLTLDDRNRVKSIGLVNSGINIPVTPLGTAEYNFRGPQNTFTWLSAQDVLTDDDKIQDATNRKLAGLSKREILKDAYVLIGITALGVFDMRAFPFDPNEPGVEGHATLLDNILSGDLIIPSANAGAFWWMLSLMIFGGILFAFLMQRLESIPALLLFFFVILAAGYCDIQILFKAKHTNWDTAFFYSEIASVFGFTIAAKYVMEERNKKFIRGAFAKYVAPAVVDSILKDPTKLTVGGEKRELTIMFSDIRSFTTFSERMDAKKLSQFLNDYLGIMTGIVFANEGTLDKYIGDAVMAFWGAPLDQPKHAGNACKAAVAMMQALAQHQERFLKEYGVDVNIGIGVNSGQVSVGNMGSNDNFAYTVIGDHVNLASRMEGLTKPYGASIVTSRFTFDSMKEAGVSVPAHRVLDFVKVKGKKNAVELIQVLDRELPEKGLVLFQEGRALYQAQKWDDAIRVLREASKLVSRSAEDPDGPCDVFIERCEEFKRTPPGEGWDGAWTMTSK